MANTKATEVIDSFESSFQDKRIIPNDLELMWLKKAVAAYCVEIEDIAYNSETYEFEEELDQYVIDTLAQSMRVYYQEREVSKVNKRVSIVTKEISIDGTNGSKTAAKNELDYQDMKSLHMFNNQKTTAYV